MYFTKKSVGLGIAKVLVVITLSAVAFVARAQNAFAQPVTQVSPELINKAREITVRILLQDNPYVPNITYEGSGVLVRGKDGLYVLTAQHIFNEDFRTDVDTIVYVEVSGQVSEFEERRFKAAIRQRSPKKLELDSMLLEMPSGLALKSLEITKVVTPATGEKVLVNGFPDNTGKFKYESLKVLPPGDIKSKIGTSEPQKFLFYKTINTSGEIDLNGVSGGPVLNLAGNLVGIQWKFDKTQKEGKAVRFSELQQIFAAQLTIANTKKASQPSSTPQRNPSAVDRTKYPPVQGLW